MPKPRRRRRPASGDSWSRILRGGLQSGIGIGLVQGINLFWPGHLTPDQATWLTGGLGWLANVVQNGLEEQGVLTPILKGQPVEAEGEQLTTEEIETIRGALESRGNAPFRSS